MVEVGLKCLTGQIIKKNIAPLCRGIPAASPFVFSRSSKGRRVFDLGAPMSLPYFRKWVDNWLASPMVMQMSWAQRGLFDHMLCVSWQVGPLELELNSLAIQLQVNVRTLRAHWQFPLSSCWVKTEDGLINLRLEQERKWAKSKTAQAKAAAETKWGRMRPHMRADVSKSKKLTCHPDPDPDPDPDKEKSKRKRKERKHMDINWDSEALDFVGADVEKLQQEITSLYREEFDSAWMNRVWAAMRDWRRKPKNRGKHYTYEEDHISGWFARDAKKEREKLDESLSQARAEEALFNSQRSDNAGAIASCEKDGGHKLIARKNAGPYCRCGYTEPRKEAT